MRSESSGKNQSYSVHNNDREKAHGLLYNGIDRMSTGCDNKINQKDESPFAYLPTDRKYRAILVDWPWFYERRSQERASKYGLATYPTLRMSEFAKLPLLQIADDPCVVFFWVTKPLIEKAIQLPLQVPGFKYKGMFVWVKVRADSEETNWKDYESVDGRAKQRTVAPVCGLGSWNRGSCEFLCMYSRNTKRVNLDDLLTPFRRVVKDVFFFRSEGHSRKPKEVYELIERLMNAQLPTQTGVEQGEPPRFLELFARVEDVRPGWDMYGHGVPDMFMRSVPLTVGSPSRRGVKRRRETSTADHPSPTTSESPPSLQTTSTCESAQTSHTSQTPEALL